MVVAIGAGTFETAAATVWVAERTAEGTDAARVAGVVVGAGTDTGADTGAGGVGVGMTAGEVAAATAVVAAGSAGDGGDGEAASGPPAGVVRGGRGFPRRVGRVAGAMGLVPSNWAVIFSIALRSSEACVGGGSVTLRPVPMRAEATGEVVRPMDSA